MLRECRNPQRPEQATLLIVQDEPFKSIIWTSRVSSVDMGTFDYGSPSLPRSSPTAETANSSAGLWAASLPSRARRRSSAHISYIIRESVPWRKSANRMLRFVIRVVILWIGRSHPGEGAQGIAVTETPGACVELRLRVVLVCRNVNEERGRGLRVLRPLFRVTAHRLREWRYPVFYDFALSRGHLRSQEWHHGRHARGGTGK
jgi:hypothetical protein